MHKNRLKNLLILTTFSLILAPSTQLATNCTVDKCIVCQDSRNLTCTNCAQGYYLKTLSGGDRKYDACWSSAKLVLSMIGALLFSILACALCYLCYKLGQNAKTTTVKKEENIMKESIKREPYYRDPYKDMTPSRIGSGPDSPYQRRSISDSPRERKYVDNNPRPIKLSNQNDQFEDRNSIVRRSTNGVPRRVIRSDQGPQGRGGRVTGYVTPPNENNVFRDNNGREYYESRIVKNDGPEFDRGNRERETRVYNGRIRDSDIGVVENEDKMPRN